VNKKYYGTIERLDISSIFRNNLDEELSGLEWEIISPKIEFSKYGPVDENVLKGYCFGCAQISTDQILIFGGKIEDKDNLYNRCKPVKTSMILDVKKNTVTYFYDLEEEESKFFDLESEKSANSSKTQPTLINGELYNKY
jgi:hypothetical protein